MLCRSQTCEHTQGTVSPLPKGPSNARPDYALVGHLKRVNLEALVTMREGPTQEPARSAVGNLQDVV